MAIPLDVLDQRLGLAEPTPTPTPTPVPTQQFTPQQVQNVQSTVQNGGFFGAQNLAGLALDIGLPIAGGLAGNVPGIIAGSLAAQVGKDRFIAPAFGQKPPSVGETLGFGALNATINAATGGTGGALRKTALKSAKLPGTKVGKGFFEDLSEQGIKTAKIAEKQGVDLLPSQIEPSIVSGGRNLFKDSTSEVALRNAQNKQIGQLSSAFQKVGKKQGIKFTKSKSGLVQVADNQADDVAKILGIKEKNVAKFIKTRDKKFTETRALFNAGGKVRTVDGKPLLSKLDELQKAADKGLFGQTSGKISRVAGKTRKLLDKQGGKLDIDNFLAANSELNDVIKANLDQFGSGNRASHLLGDLGNTLDDLTVKLGDVVRKDLGDDAAALSINKLQEARGFIAQNKRIFQGELIKKLNKVGSKPELLLKELASDPSQIDDVSRLLGDDGLQVLKKSFKNKIFKSGASKSVTDDIVNPEVAFNEIQKNKAVLDELFGPEFADDLARELDELAFIKGKVGARDPSFGISQKKLIAPEATRGESIATAFGLGGVGSGLAPVFGVDPIQAAVAGPSFGFLFPTIRTGIAKSVIRPVTDVFKPSILDITPKLLRESAGEIPQSAVRAAQAAGAGSTPFFRNLLLGESENQRGGRL